MDKKPKKIKKIAKTASERMQAMRDRNKGVKQVLNFTIGYQLYKKLKSFMKTYKLNTYSRFIEFIVTGEYARKIAHVDDYTELVSPYKESFFAHAKPYELEDLVKIDDKFYKPNGSGSWKVMMVSDIDTKREVILNLDDFV